LIRGAIPTLVWLNIKQHRFESLVILLGCCVLAAAALVEAWRLGAVHASIQCLATWKGPGVPPDGSAPLDGAARACNELAIAFFAIREGLAFRLTNQLIEVTPLLGGVVLGAALSAREIEHGTAQTSWVQGASRRPWFAAKMLAGVTLLVPIMLLVGLSADVLQAAATPTLDVHASFDAYLARGLIVVFWALAAFSGTFALGALFGRTIPAIVVAVVVCGIVRFTWDDVMTRVVLEPFAVAQEERDYSASPYFAPEPDLRIRDAFFLDGKPFEGDVYAWYAEHNPGALGDPGPTPSPGPSSAPPKGPPPPQGPVLVSFVIPGTWYWNVIAVESGLLLAGSTLAAGIAMAWIDRRRPY
jgi:hypothetical protein